MSERINETCQLQLRFVNEVVDGRELLVSRTLSGVKLTATDDNLVQAAMALVGKRSTVREVSYRKL